jgi:hypothetical protein
MTRRVGDVARHSFHQDVMSPARESVDIPDHVIGGPSSWLEMGWPRNPPAVSEDDAPRGQRTGREHVFVVPVGWDPFIPEPFTFVIERRSPFSRKAARSPVIDEATVKNHRR